MVSKRRDRKEYYKEYNKEYYSRPGIKERQKEYLKEYRARPEVKERKKEYLKEYNARPGVKERRKEYLKEYQKEYYSIPEIKERQKEYMKEYHARPEVKERKKEYHKEYYLKPENRERRREYNSSIRGRWHVAKKRSSIRNLEFNITLEYLESIYPDDSLCPLLSIPLDWSTPPNHPSTPSLDRIDSSKGYIKGNVQWVSWRANRLMSDATPDELLLIAQNYKKIYDQTILS